MFDDLIKQGNDKFKAKKYKEAIACYKRALKEEPTSTKAWGNLGMAHKALSQYSEAIKAFLQAVRIDEKYTKGLYQLAQLYFDQARYEKAAEYASQTRELLDNPKTVKLQEKIDKMLQEIAAEKQEAKAVCFSVDLKLTPDNQVKICEIGQGIRSGVKGYDTLYGKQGAMSEKFIQVLTETLKINYYNDLTEPATKEQKKERAKFVTSLQSRLKKVSQDDFDPSRIASYAFSYGGKILPLLPKRALKLDKCAPYLLACIDKGMGSLIEDVVGLKDYYPVRHRYPLFYNPALAATICKEIPGDFVVLKVTDQSEGKGVLIVPKKDIDETLKILLPNKEGSSIVENITSSKNLELKNRLLGLIEALEGWIPEGTEAPWFLAEELIDSISIEKDNKEYCPTMRVMLLGVKDDGEVKLHPVGCYWKLPSKSLGNDEIAFSLISDTASSSQNSAKVSPEHQALVYAQLKNVFIPFLNTVMNMALEDVFELVKNDSPEGKQKEYAAFYFKQTGKVLLELGLLEQAHQFLQHALSYNINPIVEARIYRFQGDCYSREEKHRDAAKSYSQAVKLGEEHKLPEIRDFYYLCGNAFLESDDEARGKQELNKLYESLGRSMMSP